MKKRPISNQVASARLALDVLTGRQTKQKTDNSNYNFTKKNIEKHRSEKLLTDFPQTVGLLIKNKIGRVDRVKRWMASIDRKERTIVEGSEARELVVPCSNVIRSRELKKLDMPIIERK